MVPGCHGIGNAAANIDRDKVVEDMPISYPHPHHLSAALQPRQMLSHHASKSRHIRFPQMLLCPQGSDSLMSHAWEQRGPEWHRLPLVSAVPPEATTLVK